MQKILIEWRKYLVEQKGADMAKIDWGPVKEKALEKVLSLLPYKNKENRRRTAALLGKYFNPKLPKKLKLTKKELLSFATTLGYKQSTYILNIPISMVDTAGWLRAGFREGMAKRAAGVYDSRKHEIFINYERHQNKKDVFSTLTHELWHAVDHTEVRRYDLLKFAEGIPEPKKVAIKKIISQNFKPMTSPHSIHQHRPTGFMSVINRANFDKLLSGGTAIAGYPRERPEPGGVKPLGLPGEVHVTVDPEPPELHRARIEAYCRRGTERHTRAKHLIGAFQQINHPDSMIATRADIVDFCVNPKKYYKIHNDLHCLRMNFVACKKYDENNTAEKFMFYLGKSPTEKFPGATKSAEILNRIVKLEIPQQQVEVPDPRAKV